MPQDRLTNSPQWARLMAGARAGAILRTRFGGFPPCSAATGIAHGPRTQRGYMIVGRMAREHCRAIVTPLLPANVERCMWEV